MLIAGANLPVTSYGKRLPDGSFAVLNKELLEFGIAEERLTRIKCDGGFSSSLEYYVSRYRHKTDDIDLYVLSSCCDLPGRSPIPRGVPVAKTMFCPHHLSHAIGSFVWSPFEEAVALVIDSGGDTLAEIPNREWWKTAREQHSVFFLSRTGHDLIDRHASEAGVAGFGELFRAFTFYLGWMGARYSGNTMALSPLGEASVLGALRLFERVGDRFYFSVENDPLCPIDMVQAFLDRNGFAYIRPRGRGAPFVNWHFHLAAFIQRELEDYLESVIQMAVRQTRCRNVVLSGGVAYNCLSIGRLRQRLADIELFV